MGRESPYPAKENADLGAAGACCAVTVASQQAGSNAKSESRTRRFMPDDGLRGFIFLSMTWLNLRGLGSHTKRICRSATTYGGSSRKVVSVGRRALARASKCKYFWVHSLSVVDYRRTRAHDSQTGARVCTAMRFRSGHAMT